MDNEKLLENYVHITESLNNVNIKINDQEHMLEDQQKSQVNNSQDIEEMQHQLQVLKDNVLVLKDDYNDLATDVQTIINKANSPNQFWLDFIGNVMYAVFGGIVTWIVQQWF